jgi:WD40 repeat protein
MHHSGTITGLLFVKQYLLACSEDSTISIVRSSDWEVVKILKGHSDHILGIDAHPSGSVLLSIGKDKTLKCWDLSKAHLSFSMKLPIIPTLVKWSMDGRYFLICMNNKVQIHSVSEGSVEHTIDFKARVNSICCGVVNDTQVWITGGEDKIIRILDFGGQSLAEWPSEHTLRIKDMALLNETLVTCSSDGTIHSWDLSSKTLQTRYDCKTRLTCIRIGLCVKPKQKEDDKKEDYPESDFDEQPNFKKQKLTVTLEVDGKKKKHKQIVRRKGI